MHMRHGYVTRETLEILILIPNQSFTAYKEGAVPAVETLCGNLECLQGYVGYNFVEWFIFLV